MIARLDCQKAVNTWLSALKPNLAEMFDDGSNFFYPLIQLQYMFMKDTFWSYLFMLLKLKLSKNILYRKFVEIVFVKFGFTWEIMNDCRNFLLSVSVMYQKFFVKNMWYGPESKQFYLYILYIVIIHQWIKYFPIERLKLWQTIF